MGIENSQSGTKNMASVSDYGLYELCKQYGERTKIWRQRFAGLLPEVFKRKLYEKKGFISIFEFAKKLAGMSEEQVRLVLNLEKRFSGTPMLKTLLTSGKVSVNKLARVVSIVTPENEKFLAMQVQVLSKNAVETLVRDEKFAMENTTIPKTFNKNVTENNHINSTLFENQNGFFEPKTAFKSLPGQTLNLSQEVQEKLIELQQKGININELLKEFLQKREEEIAQRKAEISQRNSEEKEEKQITRHIPVSIKHIVYAEHGTKCSIKNCQKPSEQIHHTQRFSLAQSHDPHYLAPLCKEHHELAHSADLAYREIRGR